MTETETLKLKLEKEQFENAELRDEVRRLRDVLEYVEKTKSEEYTADPDNKRRFELAFYDFKGHATVALRGIDE